MFNIHFNFKKFGVGLAIVIVFNLFVDYGIDTFYKSPKYEDFCNPERLKQPIKTKEDCDKIGGLWTEEENIYTPTESSPKKNPLAGIKESKPNGWCDKDFTCRKDFQKIENIYQRNLFIIRIIVGIVMIVASVFVTMQMLSTSFIFAGILSLIIGTFKHWSAMQDYLRFVILGIALGVLIYLAYKKLK